MDDLTLKYENLFNHVQTFEAVYVDTQPNGAYEDDGFIHVIKNGQRFVFYNGQNKGMLRKKDIPKYIKLVDNVLKR